MSDTPPLTPLKSAIFDEDVIRDMEQHRDDIVCCSRCSNGAQFLVVTRCCAQRTMFCPGHESEYRSRCEEAIRRHPFGVHCRSCRHRFGPLLHYTDYVKVIPV